MDKSQLKELKKISNILKAQFNLGKEGLSANFCESVENYINAHGMVKIKVLIAEDRQAVKFFAEELAKELEAEVIDLKGFTFTLYR